MEFEKPIYIIDISAGGAPYDIRLNDCPVFAESEGNLVQVKIPANRWIRKGTNTIRISMKKPSSGSGLVSVVVFIRSISDAQPPSAPLAVLSVKAEPETETEKEKQKEDVIQEENFEVEEIPFGPWRWESCDPVALDEKEKTSILDVAKRLRDSLKSKNLLQVKQILQIKSEEICQAHYQTIAERELEMDRQFGMLCDDSEWQMEEWNPKDIEFKPYSNGRLIFLEDVTTHESPLGFISKDKALRSYFGMFFYRDMDKIWKIIR